ncbi:hypothetical protein D7030_14140 [Flavobacteriaceae bacterium AU392]|nr:hypothetical protein D1817_04350 [Flavobacteriaceae bacterium]RKM81443.1 hypothetical protein D7030_14140 [Flavobacteriaceae bacterium AU392]
MTSDLRKVHKIIWIILIIAIPVLIVFSIKSIKEPLFTDSDLKIVSKNNVQNTILDNDSFHISVQGKNTSLNMLNIVVKKPLKSASSIVYGTSSDSGKEIYLGVIDKKGIYTFDIDRSIKGLRIYDDIKKIDISNLKLQWE